MKSVFFVVLLFSLNVFAQECEELTPGGYPITSHQTTLLCRTQYLVEHFDACKAPVIVVEKLLLENINGTEPRSYFVADPDLPEASKSAKKDYAHSGYDIGHMAPAADMSSEISMRESFYLSNVVPQVPNHNRGIWKSLEIRARALAAKQGEVYVVTGAVYSDDPKKIGSGVCVPTAMFKAIVDMNIKGGVAYLIPNQKVSGKKIEDFQLTILQLEEIVDMDLLPNLIREDSVKIKEVINEKLIKRM